MSTALAVAPATVVTWVLWALVLVTLVGVVVALVTDDREPTIVLAWLFLIILLPGLGLIAYFFVGRDHRRATRRRAVDREATTVLTQRRMAPVAATTHAFSDAVATDVEPTPGHRVRTAGLHEGGTVPLPADGIRLYFTGADKFADLLADLREATAYVHLMYLIWEKDELTAEVTEILLERLSAGVEVHVLYDWLSSLPYKKDELEQLSRAGAVVVPCYRRLAQLNYRNHMKMAIVDGRVVYSGGMNMGQEYIDGGKRYERWRDTHFRMTGPVVTAYLALFASAWEANGRDEDLFTGYAAPPAPHGPGDGVAVQVLHSSVSTRFPTIRDVFVVALTNARRRVWIQSPYFVPDEPLITAMCVAAASGVDVRLMMTGLPDKKIPFHAAAAYFPRLLASGVTVYRYDAGFLHAKTVSVDDELTVLGTCNWDIRSLILHDEVVAVVYDEQVARLCTEQYARDVTRCSEVTAADVEGLGPGARLRDSASRLLSRLL